MNIREKLTKDYKMDLLPFHHRKYLLEISNSIKPRVIYDIGSNLLHWTRYAKKAWPEALIVCFDASEEMSFLYKNKFDFYSYVLSEKDGEEKTFYRNLFHSSGQSLYRENPSIFPPAEGIFGPESEIKVITHKLDTIVEKHSIPLPDFIKIDVQGSELDIIKGALKTIEKCSDIILELQDVDFNIGAPKSKDVIDYMNLIGYSIVKAKFSNNRYDADYHFRKLI